MVRETGAASGGAAARALLLSVRRAPLTLINPTRPRAGTAAPAAALETIKRGCSAPGSVPAPAILSAMLEVEKARVDPAGWLEIIEAPRARWRLVFTAGACLLGIGKSAEG